MFFEEMGNVVRMKLFPATSLMLAKACRQMVGNGENDAEDAAYEAMTVAFAHAAALGTMTQMQNFTDAQRTELARIVEVVNGGVGK